MRQKTQMNWLCALGMHKWKDLGESVVITWTEPSPGMARSRALPHEVRFDQESRKVFTRRECLRCGVALKRKLVTNPDGTLSCIGWEQLPKRTLEPDEQRRHLIR